MDRIYAYEKKISLGFLSISILGCVTFAVGVLSSCSSGGESGTLLGTYPQTVVTDSTLIASLNAKAGDPTKEEWGTSYRYYDKNVVSDYMRYLDVTEGEEKYRGVYLTDYHPNETKYEKGKNTHIKSYGYKLDTIYWFKYEPISWKTLETKNGESFLITTLCLDSQDFNPTFNTHEYDGVVAEPNNYKYSNIHSWLNDNFYNLAFTGTEKTKISTTLVDNSAATTEYSPNEFACENTNDKVFLLSYADVRNADYGFSTVDYDKARIKKATDYAKIQGILCDTSKGNAAYWGLRSPFYSSRIETAYVRDTGFIAYDLSVIYTNVGLAPAIKVKL